MRTFWLAATTALTMTAAAADAQRVVAHGPAMRMGGAPHSAPMTHTAPMPHPMPMPHPGPKQWHGGHQSQWQGQAQWQHQSQSQRSNSRSVSRSNSRSSVHINVGPRWGGHIGGRWWGGGRAPGGWGAYRRPVRGFVLPSYWLSPSWFISDWGAYGLSQPPYGYNWSRYYDDAVLVDGRGSVYDTVGGVAWDGADAPGTDYAYDESSNGDDRSDDGYADGRYDALGAPYAYSDGAEDRGPPPPPHHARPPAARYAPPMAAAPGHPVVIQSGGSYANGYYYPAPTVTTVTVTTTPVVTTTTEVFEDTVTYTRRPAKRVWHKRVVRARPRCTCS